MSAYTMRYIVGATDINIISYIADFKLERELEKMLDKLTFKVSRRINSLTEFTYSEFSPNVEIYLLFNNIGIFRGRIKTSNLKEFYEVEAYSCAEILDHIIVQKVYENTTPEAIFTDLINTYSDLTSSTDSSGVTVERFVADDTINAIISKLAQTLNWLIYTDASKTIYFKARGSVTNNSVIRRQSDNTNAKFGQWKKDFNEMCNDMRVYGDNTNYDTIEQSTGDGVTTIFNITQQPIAVRITIDGTEIHPDLYSVSSETKEITFINPPGNTSSIIIYYTYVYPLYVVRQNIESIQLNGRFSKIFIHKWLKTRNDIITYCNNFITTYKDPLLNNDVQINPTYITIFTPGEKVRIIDDLEGYDDYYVINKIKLEYLKGYVELNVGSYIPIFSNIQTVIQDRIKELEKNLSKQYVQLYSSQSETITTSDSTFSQSDINDINLKLGSSGPRCDYGRGSLYDARVGLCALSQ